MLPVPVLQETGYRDGVADKDLKATLKPIIVVFVGIAVTSGRILPKERIVTALFTHLYVLVVKSFSIIQQFGSDEAEDEIFQERHELNTFGLRHKERRSLCQTTIHATKCVF